LLHQLDGYQGTLYPPTSVHTVSADAMKTSGAIFFIARRAGTAVGCGAYLRCNSRDGELKRMFVLPEARGLGIGRRILEALEKHARSAGLQRLRLETGVAQPEALRLYARAGYVRCQRFGDYPDDPLSVFMEKRIAD
jgi:putative acetyltransferase